MTTPPAAAAATPPVVSRQLRALVRSELKIEMRAGEVLFTTLPFAVTALIVVALSVGADVPLLRRIGPGLYWALVVLFGSFVVLRRTHNDMAAHRDLLALLGVDPVVRHVARAAVTAGLLLAFQLLLAPVAVLLYDPSLEAPVVAFAMSILLALGLGSLGTLAADLTTGGRGRMALVPLLVAPLLVPMVLAAVQAQQARLYQTSVAPWLVLAATMTAVSVLAGLLSARSLSGENT